MKKYVSSAIALTALSFFLGACSSHPTEAEIAAPQQKKAAAPGASIEAQQVAAEQKADFVGEITFSKKQKTLSPANQSVIEKLLKDAHGRGKIQEVRVITWADSEYPSINTKKLSNPDQRLVKERNEAIESFLKSQTSDLKIKSYSMAERANSLKDFIGSAESRIKKSLEVAGIPTTDTSVKYPSKASKSILLIMME